MRYSEDVIEQVRNANDIVDVIGQYIKLTKKGSSYFGLCPFHGEKTPSFSVSPQKQIYYCFGCGAGGNVITFLMQYENYTFTEALKVLAERAHITLPEVSSSGYDRSQAELKEKLLEINRTAAMYYYEQLKSEAGQIGYRYFREKRRLTDATITHFGLGFAPKSSDALYRFLKGRGYNDELLSQSGLVVLSERGARDKFWIRVMFPIMDTNNRVVGFGGRVMGDGEPKYLNSPETKIFDKSRNLYGLNFAKRSRKDYLLLCEGYMDVIALHQAGFTNAVASLGTAFNEKHAQLLRRYTKNVILTQDNDEAGIRAKLRAFPILREAGLNVRVLDTSDTGFKDPDEFLQHLGPEEYEEYIRKAKNAFLYEIDMLRRSYQFSDPAEVTAFYNETAERLCGFSEELERDNYVRAVSREQQIPYGELKQLVERKMLTVQKKKPEQKARPEAGGAAASRNGRKQGDRGQIPSERLLLSWLCAKPELIQQIKKYLRPEDFTDGTCREIAEKLLGDPRDGETVSAASIMDSYSEDEEKSREAGAILNADAVYKDLSELSLQDLEKSLTEAVLNIRRASLEREIRDSGSDLQRLQQLLSEKKALSGLRIRLQE